MVQPPSSHALSPGGNANPKESGPDNPMDCGGDTKLNPAVLITFSWVIKPIRVPRAPPRCHQVPWCDLITHPQRNPGDGGEIGVKSGESRVPRNNNPFTPDERRPVKSPKASSGFHPKAVVTRRVSPVGACRVTRGSAKRRFPPRRARPRGKPRRGLGRGNPAGKP